MKTNPKIRNNIESIGFAIPDDYSADPFSWRILCSKSDLCG